MKPRWWVRAFGLLACWLFLVGTAAAERQAVWNAAVMLQETSSEHIALRTSEGKVAERIDRAFVQRSVNVLQRLASAYGISTPDLYVMVSNTPNAFATVRGGKQMVGINTAMLKLTGDNEDYLAVVMGHELGHLQARHTTEGAQRAAAVSIIGALLGAAIDVNQAKHGRDTHGLGAATGALGANLLNAKFSRDQEREADRLGITAMATAGYDPSSAAVLWRLMAGSGSGGSGFWLSTHPSHDERQTELAALARELEPVYATNKAANVTSVVASSEPARPAAAPRVTLTAQQSSAGVEVAALASSSAAVASADAGTSKALTDREFAARSMDRAAQGEASAIAQLAFMHLSGVGGLPKDYGKARIYSERATLAGDPLGKAVYGTLLRDGIAGPGDAARGITLLKEAADANVGWAHYQLGIAYERGLGISADRDKALIHLEAAAATMREAQERLATLGADSK